MQFSVDFSSNLTWMLRENTALSSFWNHYYCNYDYRLIELLLYSGIDPMYFREDHHLGCCAPTQLILEHLVKNQIKVNDPLYFYIFLAFLNAEILFVKNYIPQNSNEERLTGHLISEIANSLNIVKGEFIKKSYEVYKCSLDLEFCYSDLSTNNAERVNGSDFGFIFHINLPNQPERVKAIIIQAKRLDKKTVIDLNQMRNLNLYAKDLAFYCFYDLNSIERLPPLILSQNMLKNYINKEEDINQLSYSIKREIITKYNHSLPLSLFIPYFLFKYSDTSLRLFKTVWEAKNYLESDNRNHSLTRVLSVSLGGLTKNQDLTDISQLFKNSNKKFED